MADFPHRLGITNFAWPASTPSFSNQTVGDSTSGCAFVMQARNANAITHIGFRYGARTGTPPTFVATLEGVDATTGQPDGTDVGGGSPTAKTFTPPADTTWDGLWQWITLTNAYTPTRGQLLCATIRYSSGTIDASNRSSFTNVVSNLNAGQRYGHPLALTLTTGSWTKLQNTLVGAFRTASERYGNIMESYYSTRSASTVGHRRALKFSLPSGSCSSFSVVGVKFAGTIAAATGKNPIVGLWNGAGSMLQDVTVDADIPAAVTTASENYEYFFNESSLAVLTANTTYYIGLEVADAANGGVQLNGIGVNNNADLAALTGGTGWCLSSWDGSSWTDDTLTRPLVELILSDVTGGSGGGAPVLINGGVIQ